MNFEIVELFFSFYQKEEKQQMEPLAKNLKNLHENVNIRRNQKNAKYFQPLE